MGNAITIQDELVAKLARYNPSGATYPSLTTRAARKARRELMEGLSVEQADNLIYDCHEMALLMRAVNCGPVIKAELARAEGC